MGISIRDTILFLIISSAFIGLTHAGSCGGACAISGSSSYDFLGDPSINSNLDTFDDFIRDNLNQASLFTNSISPEVPAIDPSLNQTNEGNASLNSTTTYNVTDNPGNHTFENTTVRLGASSIKNEKLSTLAFDIFNNDMF